MGPAGMSVDGSVAYATVTFGAPVGEIPLADVSAVLEATQAANGVDGLPSGPAARPWRPPPRSRPAREGIGVTIALFILLFAFGSLIGALLPDRHRPAVGLGLGQALVLITANFFNVATFAPTLAAMIGLGVGIDYSLFVINRYRQALEAGRDPREAPSWSPFGTAGRAVLFAAATVIIALRGLFVLGFEFFNGLAVAASFTVVMVMLSAPRSCCPRCSRCWAVGRFACGCRGPASRRCTTRRVRVRPLRPLAAAALPVVGASAPWPSCVILALPIGSHAPGLPRRRRPARGQLRRGSPTTCSPRASAPG